MDKRCAELLAKLAASEALREAAEAEMKRTATTLGRLRRRIRQMGWNPDCLERDLDAPQGLGLQTLENHK